jgi:hypothetical protein
MRALVLLFDRFTRTAQPIEWVNTFMPTCAATPPDIMIFRLSAPRLMCWRTAFLSTVLQQILQHVLRFV